MRKNELYVYTALSLAVLIPFPGRFAYGLILVLMLYLLSVLGILFKKLSSLFFEYGMHSVLVAVMLVVCTVFLRQILILISPLCAFVLGVSIYAPAFSAFILGNLYRKTGLSLVNSLKFSIAKCNGFSVFALVYFAIRDIFGYGTLTLPCPSGLNEVVVLHGGKLSFLGFFWASIPGAVVLLAIMTSAIAMIMKRNEIRRTSRGGSNA